MTDCHLRMYKYGVIDVFKVSDMTCNLSRRGNMQHDMDTICVIKADKHSVQFD